MKVRWSDDSSARTARKAASPKTSCSWMCRYGCDAANCARSAESGGSGVEEASDGGSGGAVASTVCARAPAFSAFRRFFSRRASFSSFVRFILRTPT